MLNGIFILRDGLIDAVYPSDIREALAPCVKCSGPYSGGGFKPDPGLLGEIEVVFGSWGTATIDKSFLQAAPRLKAVFYAAGTVSNVVTEDFWSHDIVLCSSWGANAIPVADYTVSQILFCLKMGWLRVRQVKELRAFPRNVDQSQIPGAYKTTVGLISLGMIARHVIRMLKVHDVNVIAYDPYVKPDEAANLGIRLVSLDEIFRQAEVVSLHAPWLKETEEMITGKHFESMKKNAAFINTARGKIVREQEMISVLKQRPDLQAVLDVTWPEPPASDSPLYDMPNVVITPHIAGSMGGERARLGQFMLDEFLRFVRGEPLLYRVSREMWAQSTGSKVR